VAERYALRRLEDVQQHTGVDQERRRDDEAEVGAGARQRHPGRAARVAASPGGIVGRAGEPERPPRDQHRDHRQHDHPERLAADVRHRIDGDLAAVVGGEVAAAHRRPRVRRLVQRGGEQEDGVVEERFTEIGHRISG
jgi:hypothetical protein